MWTVLALQAGRQDPVSGLRHPRGTDDRGPPTMAVELEGAGGRGRGAAGRAGDGAGCWGRRQDLLYLPSALTLTAPRCAERSGKQRS